MDCDDGDACTNDVCEPAIGCVHPPLAPPANATCTADNVREVLDEITCTGRCRCELERRLAKVEGKVAGAVGAARERRCTRRLKRARRIAGKLGHKIARQVEAGCVEPQTLGAELRDEIAAMAERLDALISSDLCLRP